MTEEANLPYGKKWLLQNKWNCLLSVLAAIALILLPNYPQLVKVDFTAIPGRALWQKPAKVIETLEIREGDQVADLGTGKGYFLPFLAAVGPSGKVFAVDVEEDIIEALENRIAEEGYHNVETVLGEYDDPLLPDTAIDLVLIVNTYHHIENRSDYFSRLRHDLKPNGRVAIIDPDADIWGVLALAIDNDHQSSREDVRREMAAAGYRLERSSDLLPVQLFDVFVPQ